MIIRSELAEAAAVLNAAHMMCAAARTAPKTRAIDNIKTLILTDDDIKRVSDYMIETAGDRGFVLRDADNILHAEAVVMIGVRKAAYGLDCKYCGFANCEECINAKGACVFATTDLGIAVGSAVSVAADLRVDNRVMYSVGRAFGEMDESGEEETIWLGIPLSVSGKNPFFDRKRPVK